MGAPVGGVPDDHRTLALQNHARIFGKCRGKASRYPARSAIVPPQKKK
jgi:hypothetical protein